MNPRLGRWERVAELPLMVSAIIFFAAFAVPIIWWPSTPDVVTATCEVLVWVTWAAFAIDYLVRLLLSEQRWAFVRESWFDLVVIALPVLRPLRLLRLVTVLSVVNRRASSDLRGKVGLYVAGASVLVAVVGALAVVDAERGAPDANITSIGDAFWWAAATMTTVGYGDQYPVTPLGRVVAVGLMVCGVAILGTVTASLASWIVERVADAKDESSTIMSELAALRREVAALEHMVRQMPDDDDSTAGASSDAAPQQVQENLP